MSDSAPRGRLLTKLGRLRRAYFLAVAGKYSLLLASAALAVMVTLAWSTEVERLTVFQAPGLLLLALVVAVLAAALRAPSLGAVARRADDEFGLENRTQTALEHIGAADEMALLLTADAERRLPSTWTGTRLFDYRREARVAVLVFVIPVALALVTWSVIDIATSDGGSSIDGSRTVVTTGSLDTERQLEGVVRTAASSTEAISPEDENTAADRNARSPKGGLESATGPSDGRNGEQLPGLDQSHVGGEAQTSVASASDAEGSSGSGTGESDSSDASPSESSGASSSGTAARAVAAEFEGVAAPGTGAAASGGAAADARSGGQSPSEAPDTVESATPDPRRTSSYPELWNRAQAVPLAERIPAGLRRYIRDYFTAVGPRPQ